MSHLFRKVVLFLVFLIAILQIIHMSLMSRLESRLQVKIDENEKRTNNQSENEKATDLYSHLNYDKHLSKYSNEQIMNEREQMYKSLRSLSSVLDSSGEYRIIHSISTATAFEDSRWRFSIVNKLDILENGNHLYKQNDLSIATHSTLTQLHHLDLLAQRWQNGPISVAIFATTIQQLPIIIETILLLRYCNVFIRNNTNFHLVYPLNLFSSTKKLNANQMQNVFDSLHWSNVQKIYDEFDGMIAEHNCGRRMQESIEKLDRKYNHNAEQSSNYNHPVPYPNNLLRNVARRYSLTEYTLVIDVDLIPSKNLYDHFLNFIHKSKVENNYKSQLEHNENIHSNSLVVYVMPTFEIDLNSAAKFKENNDLDGLIPGNKLELIGAIQKQYVRPFYIELCWKCHKYTDYNAWLQQTNHLVNHSSSHSGDDIRILYYVQWHDAWEPFYISHNHVPFYDERFRQYGFNRISQTCELNMAGYQFAVIDNAFLIHRGFKVANNFHSTKDLEIENNRILYRKFKLQLKDKYSSSGRKC